MNEQSQTISSNDELTKDFLTAAFVVSVIINLIVATTWMVYSFAGL